VCLSVNKQIYILYIFVLKIISRFACFTSLDVKLYKIKKKATLQRELSSYVGEGLKAGGGERETVNKHIYIKYNIYVSIPGGGVDTRIAAGVA
jgi:hypothetical protein